MANKPTRVQSVLANVISLHRRPTFDHRDLTCCAVDRAEGVNALAVLTARANTRTVLENIIAILSLEKLPRRQLW